MYEFEMSEPRIKFWYSVWKTLDKLASHLDYLRNKVRNKFWQARGQFLAQNTHKEGN